MKKIIFDFTNKRNDDIRKTLGPYYGQPETVSAMRLMNIAVSREMRRARLAEREMPVPEVTEIVHEDQEGGTYEMRYQKQSGLENELSKPRNY